MSDILIEGGEEQKPEVQLPVTVFFHADIEDEVELRDRITLIRHAIETALADEENDLVGFTYPEVRLQQPTARGRTLSV